MKQLIVMVATLMLGIFLFTLIAGEQDGSVLSTVKDVWLQEIDARNMSEPVGGR